MKLFKEDTAVAAISELRTGLDEILRQLRKTSVILERHKKPVAVMVNPARIEQMEEAFENACDIILAFEAHGREASARNGKYVSLDEAERRSL
ncbi:MAG: type II toxin-antitoxin system Phd/YefM family antitoxin [Elusimicrobia bacterium]|nr:type II toxin-antitoxin system Phd/YefM family antitoxin [Elusimicrobiota bacterium]